MSNNLKFKDGDIVYVTFGQEYVLTGTVRGVSPQPYINLWAIEIHDQYMDLMEKYNNGFSTLIVLEQLIELLND